jgi:23S rRNA pseudouridine1911/1915/1917 synthase
MMNVMLNSGFDYRERIDGAAAGLSVLDHLARRYPHSTRQEWMERLEAGRVLLDGLPVAPRTVLRAGHLLVWRRPPWVEPDVPLACAILHRDAHLLAVGKPRGLPTMPAGGFLEHTLLHVIRRRYPEASPLHRLDRGTSGVVLFARTPAARAALAAAWRRPGRGETAVTKVYRALARGVPTWEEVLIDTPIGAVPHPMLGTVHAACPGGRPARSVARVLERRGGDSLIEVSLETGRPHQARIHLAAAGHPLVGEPLYVPGGHPATEGGGLPGDPGYHLHAHRLAFTHPETGASTIIECCPPPRLRRRGKA